MELNKEQHQAVKHDRGPLLIIAGAGTGKTRVVTSRIVDLIESKKALPTEILALTFTEKAANEMSERIDTQIPLSYEEVCIKTFHGFSERVLRESGLEIGIDPGFKILDQVNQWFFFKKHLYEFDLDYYRPLGNPNKFIYELLSHFGKLKDELITPQSYLNFSERVDGDDKKKMQEIANVFKKYNKLLIKNNYLDFADLTYMALELFNKRPTVLEEYSERYKYIMVDEFQDTNYGQYMLVKMLADKHRNIVVVGDDDQSIYKWRGASLSNILKFEQDYPDLNKVVLNDNYRSSNCILGASYQLIRNNDPDRLEHRSGINKKLRCNTETDSPVEIHQFPSYVQENSFIGEQIALLKKNGGSMGDVAILLRSNYLANTIIDELEYRGIPYQVRSPKGLMSLEEIKDLIALIKFIAHPGGDKYLLRLLKLQIFDISMSEILELLNSPEKDSLFNNIKKRKLNMESTPQLIQSPIFDVLKLLQDLIEFSKQNSVGLVINEFLSKTNYLKYLIDQEKYEQLENINEFAKVVSKFEHDNPDKAVYDFANYLDLLDEANASLNFDKLPDKDSVQILTAHGSKGLEFDYVFLANIVKQRFPVSKRRETFFVPEALTNEIYPEGDFHIQEERRLFYVAMTRAKKRLYITYSDSYEGNKAWKPSPFIEEIQSSEFTITTRHKETEDAIAKLKSMKKPNKPIFELPPFKSKRLSYTQLDTFVKCPLKYSYRYCMKIPVPLHHSAVFGTAIHETLKALYQGLKNGVEVKGDYLEKLFDKYWVPYGFESKEHENLRKEKGFELLKTYCETNSNPWVIPAFLERPFNLRVGEYTINGRIDRIDRLEDNSYEIIDYKTGRIPSYLNLKKDLQLSIYALAAKEIFGINVSRLSLYYLEDNKKVSTERSDEDLEIVRKDIGDIIEKMKHSDFSPTPAFLCKFCDFRILCPAV